MKYMFNKEQRDAILELIQSYHLSPGCRSSATDSVHYWNIRSYLDAQALLQEQGLTTCPKCNLNPHKVMGGCPCEYCGMIGQMPWGG